MLVEVGASNPGTVGTAFDLMMRFRTHPSGVPAEPLRGMSALARSSVMLRFFGRRAIRSVIQEAQVAADVGNTRRLAQACWPLALATEVYRAGVWLPGSPLVQLLGKRRVSRRSLLGLATDDAVGELMQLCDVASERFIPWLRSPVVLAPSFKASKLLPADADLIAGGSLLELKVMAGTTSQRTGLKRDFLKKEYLYQVLLYALFDTMDDYGITDLGIYSARYGNLHTWPLLEVMERSAGQRMNVASERLAVWSLLGGRVR